MGQKGRKSIDLATSLGTRHESRGGSDCRRRREKSRDRGPDRELSRERDHATPPTRDRDDLRSSKELRESRNLHREQIKADTRDRWDRGLACLPATSLLLARTTEPRFLFTFKLNFACSLNPSRFFAPRASRIRRCYGELLSALLCAAFVQAVVDSLYQF